jgi:branched-chain amino acid transport system permease protein
LIPRAIKPFFPALGLIAILIVIGAIVHLAKNGELEGILIEALIYMVMVVALSIFVSNSGVISFGHVTFALIGAYASAWQTCCTGIRGVFMPGLPELLLHADVPVLPASIAGAIAATAVAAIAGLIIMRLSSVAASIALLSLLFVFKTIYENWSSMTAGQSSLVGLPLYVDLWSALAWVAVTIVAAQIYMSSAHGLRLRAAREDEVAARASGIVVWRERLIAFVISAFFLCDRRHLVRPFSWHAGRQHVLAQYDLPDAGNACGWRPAQFDRRGRRHARRRGHPRLSSHP